VGIYTHLPFYLRQCTVHRRMSDSQSRSGRCRIKTILLSLPGIEPRPFHDSASRMIRSDLYFVTTKLTWRYRSVLINQKLKLLVVKKKLKEKTSPVIGRGGLSGCEILRMSHCLDSRFTDGGEIVSSRTGRALLPRYFFSDSGTHFC
jgi:hypothetical protein